MHVVWDFLVIVKCSLSFKRIHFVINVVCAVCVGGLAEGMAAGSMLTTVFWFVSLKSRHIYGFYVCDLYRVKI